MLAAVDDDMVVNDEAADADCAVIDEVIAATDDATDPETLVKDAAADPETVVKADAADELKSVTLPLIAVCVPKLPLTESGVANPPPPTNVILPSITKYRFKPKWKCNSSCQPCYI